MRIKKTMATFVAATMLFGSTGMAFASVDDSINRLNTIGLVKGYTDGSFKPEQNITRAEYAAIAVRALGLESAAQFAKGATKFKDVPASHWASGYINLAVEQGVIQGYPDGTFKPDANVTTAEAIAMMVRVLGYEPVLTGTWPTKYIAKASSLGLLENLNVNNFNTAAKRGDVFVIANTALEVKPLVQEGYGSTSTYKEADKTLVEKKLAVTVKPEGEVTSVPNYGTKGKITISYGQNSDTLDVADYIDANALYGAKVVAWVKDNKVIYVNVKNQDKIIYDTVDAISDNSVKLKDKNTTYSFATDNNGNVETIAKKNFNEATNYTQDFPVGTKVKVVLNDVGKVKYIEAFTYTTGTVKEVKTADEKIVLSANAGSLELKDKDVVIVKNGKAIKLADIKAGDVLDYVTNNTKCYIYVTDSKETGKLNSYTLDGTKTKISINGKTIELISGAKLSTDGGSTWSATVSDLVGKNVTVRLNKDGKASEIVADAVTDNSIPVWVKVVDNENTAAGLIYVKAGKFDGTNTVFYVANKAKVNGTEKSYDKNNYPFANTLVKLVLNSEGKVAEFKTYSTTEKVTATDPVTINKDAKTLTFGYNSYKVNDNTKIVFINADGDIKTMTWDTLKGQADSNNEIGYDMEAVVDAGVIKYLVVKANANLTVSSDTKFGVVVGYGEDADGKFTNVLINNTVTKFKGWLTYKIDVDQQGNDIFDKYATGTLVEFVLVDNEMPAQNTDKSVIYKQYNVFENQQVLFTSAVLLVTDINEAEKRIEVKVLEENGTLESDKFWIDYSANVQVFKGKDKKSISDLVKGSTKIKIADTLKTNGDAGSDDIFDFISIQE